MWPAIIDQETFYKVQTLLKKNRYRFKGETKTRHPYLLTSLLFCGKCNDRLCGKSAHGNGGKVAYYEHAWAIKSQAGLKAKVFICRPLRFLAPDVEGVLWNEILKLIGDPQYAKQILNKATELHKSQNKEKDADKYKTQIKQFSLQLDALAEHLSKIPKTVSPEPIFKQMQKAEEMREGVQVKLDDMKRHGFLTDQPVDFATYEKFLSLLRIDATNDIAPENKRKIIGKLICRIDLNPAGLKIFYKVGKSAFDWELKDSPQSPLKPDFRNNGSTTLTNGGPSRNRTYNCSLGKSRYIHLTMGPWL